VGDTWFTTDGINWQKTNTDGPWRGREDHGVAVWRDALWLVGGMNDPGDPAKNICFSYLRLLDHAESEVSALEARYRSGTVGDVEIKKLVYEVFMSYMQPFRTRKAELESDPTAIDQLRQQGASRAREIAAASLARIREAVGV
jgi:tryptophanyl-tRNA synthetase